MDEFLTNIIFKYYEDHWNFQDIHKKVNFKFTNGDKILDKNGNTHTVTSVVYDPFNDTFTVTACQII